MKSVKASAFLSCSFDPADTELNEFFNTICKSLDIDCVNVRDGYKETPAEKAREMINSSQLFIAIATRREKSDADTYNMPAAVHDEISIAYALQKPMLLFREDAVNFKGFLSNYGTHVTFFRSRIKENESIRTIISSVHNIKVDVVVPSEIVPEQEVSGFYAEYLHGLYELIKEGDDFTWVYSTTRRLVFTDTFVSAIKHGAWSTIGPKCDDQNHRIERKINFERGSKQFKFETTVDRDDVHCFEGSTKVIPTPLKGDWLELSQWYRSKYFNRIHKNKGEECKGYVIGDHSFDCFDGTVPIVRTKDLRVQIRFPKEYELKQEDTFPFVGSYSSGIDYLVKSEMKRAKIETQNFGGNLIIDIQVESPLLRHLYGVAWRLPQ